MKLTDEQTAQLAQLAATVPEYWRSGFMQDVQQRLDGYRQPSNTVLQKAIGAALGGLGVNTMAVFLCDAAVPTKEVNMGRTFQVGDATDEREMQRREARGLPILADGERLHVGIRFMDADSRTGDQRAAIEAAKASTYRAGERAETGKPHPPDEIYLASTFLPEIWRVTCL